MKNKEPFLISALFVVVTTVLIIGFASCKKEVSATGGVPAGQTQLKVMLTDAPSTIFDSIFIDIQKVEIKVEDSTGAEHWDALTFTPGVYNILRFRNGLDTLLGTVNIPKGKVEKIRITLGTGSYVMFGGVKTLLTIPSGANQIIIKVDDDVDHEDDNHSRIWLDFDGVGSIRLNNGKLELKLNVNHFCKHSSGELEGKIKPKDALPVVVRAVAGTDTLTAIPEDEGEFKIRGIKTSTVKLLITASNGYKDSVINNIQIRQGEDTKVGTIVLHR
jgi:Domain of unknown function (DUF4382)